MSSEQWERVKEVFEQALNLPFHERAAYLDSVYENDPELHAAAKQLLEAHSQAGSFMDRLWSVREVKPVFTAGQLVANRFRILSLLSRGGMGEVYEAFDEKLQLKIALKTLRPEFASDREALRRFEREIRVARQVTHHTLCRVFDLIEHKSGDAPDGVVPCLTMQLLCGESLQSYLERCRPLSPNDALPLIRQIGQALQVLHENGIVHRDLKPSNVMVVPQENGTLRIVVMDFGLAKPMNGINEQFESQIGFRAGAPYFMAPELLQGEPPSIESDIYAFGLVIDEMVTKSRAFPAQSHEELLYQRLNKPPVEPTQRADNLPPYWDKAILKCLALRPAQRYRRALDVVTELDSIPTLVLKNTSELLAPVRRFWRRARTASAAKPTDKTVSRRPLIYAAIAIPVVMGLLSLSAIVGKPINTSVVVFPLENLTSQPELNYLCKGTGFELTNRLSRVNGMRVIPFYEPRSQSSRLPSQGAFSISGYLQNATDHAQIVLQLTDNRDGSLVWSDKFERKLNSQLELQNEIADQTVRAIETRLLRSYGDSLNIPGALLATPLRHVFGFQRSTQAETNSSAALDLYMRGRYLWDARTVAATLQAIQLFRKATEEDPQFGLAWAALSEAQFVLMDYNYAPLPELEAKAREYAQRAITVTPNTAEGYVTLAAIEQMEWRWNRSEVEYRRALSVNPKNARAHRWYAGLLVQSGRFEEAFQQSQQAISLDPYEYSHRAGYGLYLYYAGRYYDAVHELESLLTQKDLLSAHIVLSYTYAMIGSQSTGEQAAQWFEKALREAEIVRKKESAQPVMTYAGPLLAQIYAMRGDKVQAQKSLQSLLPAMASGTLSPVPIAQIYVALGDNAAALNLLEIAHQNRDRQLQYINVSPLFRGLRQSDRFRSLVRSMQLEAVKQEGDHGHKA